MKKTKQFLTLLLILVVTLGVTACDSVATTSEETTTYTTVLETTVTTTEVTTTTIPTTETTTLTTQTTTEENTTQSTTSLPTTQTSTTQQTTTTTTYVNGDTLVITSPEKTSYLVYDALDLTGLVVTYIDMQGNEYSLRDDEYTVSAVDMTIYGTQEVVIEYQTYASSFLIEVSLPSYVSSAANLSGNTLFLELRSIVNTGFNGVSYGDARYILDETDRDPNNSSNLIEVYTGDSVSGAWDCPSGVCVWNREHVWPQSGMPVSASNSVTNMASDLHNLKPSDPGENSYRGNKWFDNVSNSVAYEPRDEVKGDIARIMLYMIVMYDELTLVDGTPNIDNYEMGLFSVLLEWNEQDPVDDFERNRNEVIYDYQGNYNPFIFYPDFADLIWSE